VVQTAPTYSEIERQARAAVSDIGGNIKHALRSLGDPYLVRAQIGEPRIKSQESLRRKALIHRWKPEDAITNASDFLGFRIACNNLEDVFRSADLLQEFFRNQGTTVEREDYVAKPKPSGYRAIHLTFRISLSVNGKSVDVGCEIQIRSLLQNAWAELSRADIYTEDVPASIQRQAKSLAGQLSRADATAEKIRRRIARPRRGRQPKPGQPLTASSLAFIYRAVFGEDPPEYLLEYVLRETDGADVRSDGLHALLQEEQFISRLKSSYHDVAGFDAMPEQLFRWAASAMPHGKEAAIRAAAREARQEWEEIRSIAQREILPDARDFERRLLSLEYAQKDDDPDSDIQSWASALGATVPCSFCGTPIVNPDRLAKAAAKYYGKRGEVARSIRARVKDATEDSGVETGSWDNSGMCGHCSYMLYKD
jgi:ppGpp synthetase/RelA/SpoT-type nucleotidyltranferase